MNYLLVAKCVHMNYLLVAKCVHMQRGRKVLKSGGAKPCGGVLHLVHPPSSQDLGFERGKGKMRGYLFSVYRAEEERYI